MTATDDAKTVSGATLWSLMNFVCGVAINVLVLVTLARLLTPADFGTFALLAIFLGVSTAIVEGGFGLALIQRQDTSEEDHSTVFWISLCSASIIATGLAAAAPSIASFFELTVLVELTYIMSASIWISSFGVVNRALLVKRLELKTLTIVKLAAVAISGFVAVILAYQGNGVHALAWQALASSSISSILLWRLGGWRPSSSARAKSARRLFIFGGYMFASQVLEVVYSKAYTLLIGKSYGTLELGFFHRAEGTAGLVAGLVLHPIGQVAFPAFSRMEGNTDRIRSGIKDGIRISMLFNSTAMLTLSILAEPFVITVFGPQWESSIKLLQVLVLSSLLMPLHLINLQALMAVGRSDLFFLLEIAKKVLGVSVLIVAASHGPIGIAWGILISGLISFFINSWYSGKLFGFGPFRQIMHVLPCLAVGCAAATASHMALEIIDTQEHAVALVVGMGSSTTVLGAILGAAWFLGSDLTGALPKRRVS